MAVLAWSAGTTTTAAPRAPGRRRRRPATDASVRLDSPATTATSSSTSARRNRVLTVRHTVRPSVGQLCRR